MSTKILMTGVTGYLGGTVLDRFLSRADAAELELTVLVRDAKKAEVFRAAGVNAIVGALDDSALLARLASEADAVISMADADDMGAANATLAGMKKRFEATGRAPILIHTSGGAALMDQAKGMYASDVVHDDSSKVPSTRGPDIAFVKADAEGYMKSYIVIPSAIWGVPKGRFAAAGVQNMQTKFLPGLISVALKSGRPMIIGEGKNIWGDVEVNDLAELYPLLWDAILADDNLGHGANGFFFGSNTEFVHRELAGVIGAALVGLSKISASAAVPTQPPADALQKYVGGFGQFFGNNFRCRATRARAIGWKPIKTAKELFAYIPTEVEVMVKKLQI